MLTAWCFLALIASMFFIGTAVRGVLAQGKALDEGAWIQVPFIGIAVTIAILQFQLYCEVPINRGVFALWAVAASVVLIWLRYGEVKQSLRNLPMLPFVVAGAVLSVQALGMVRVGPDDYVGRSWSDQFNYTVMAECFRTRGFAVGFEDVGQDAWLVRIVDLKNLRIGQSVLQAYHGVITRMDTRSQFMPTILLSCPLIVLALYAAARALNMERRHAALAAAFGGLVPGITLLVQESFLSHALGIPFLLLLPVLLSTYNLDRSAAALGAAVLFLGALASIYTEFLLLELLLVAGFFTLALAQRPRRLVHLLGYAVLLAAPWLCNPLFHAMTGFLTSPLMTAPGVLAHIYPWAYDTLGLGVLWLGDRCAENVAGKWMPLARFFGVVVTAIGAAGLLTLALGCIVRWRRAGWASPPNGFDLRLALLGLGLIPAVMVLNDQDHPYQFFKLLVTVSPLYALGIIALAAYLMPLVARRYAGRPALQRGAIIAVGLCAICVVGVAAASTGRMALHSANPAHWVRSSQHIALSHDFKGLRQHLEALHGESIVIRPSDNYLGYQQVWSLYFARHNQVWMTFPYHNDGVNMKTLPALAQLTDLTQMPSHHLVLCPRDSIFLLPPKGFPASEVIWENGAYMLWKRDNRPWACITHVDNPNGNECHNGRCLWLSGEESVFHFHASEAGVGQFWAYLNNGPSIEPGDELRLLIKDNNGNRHMMQITEGPLVLPLMLNRGHNTLAIQVLNPRQKAGQGDPRPLLAQFRFENLEFQPSVAPIARPLQVHEN